MSPLHMASPADLKAALGRQSYAEDTSAELDGRGFIVHRTRESATSAAAVAPKPATR